jgi:hypothetical protein
MNIQFTEKDRQELRERGIPEEQIEAQIEIFRKGIPPVKLLRPCTVNDGVKVIYSPEEKRLSDIYREAAASGRAMKFVPASGAATRMFKALQSVINRFPGLPPQKLREAAVEGNKEVQQLLRFFQELKKLAFYDTLKETLAGRRRDLEELLARENYGEILSALLDPEGLNYNNRPKGLIKFHKYPDSARNPFEEHLMEAANYVRDRQNVARDHFTISIPIDFNSVEIRYIESIRQRYEEQEGVTFELTFSNQNKSTDTIAVDLDNQPLREADGRLHFRPGGHGALLKNLNDLEGDIIFIKNIDNVVPDRLKPETYHYKILLGGYLVALQNEMFAYLEKLSAAEADDKLVGSMFRFAKEKLSVTIPQEIENGARKGQIEFLFSRLNRPLRVCGMVKNEGEPGGGPFWVEMEDQSPSPQIVESAQVDLNDPQQKTIWESSTHFNPVDLVCGVRDFRGRLFNLPDFRDPGGGFISRKFRNGQELKALELPGLWNGAMAYWNTVFVEVPIITFNPVKTVLDLLRPEHQPE